MKKETKIPAILGKLFAVCSKDVHSVINRVLIKDNKAIALDGYIMAIRPVTGLDGVTALIPAETAKKLTKATSLEVSEPNPMGGITVSDGQTIYAIPSNGHGPEMFPRYDQVIPNNKGVQVKINAEYLKRVADAVSSNGQVTLTFSDDKPSTLAIHVEGDEGYGVIMPVRLD